MKKGNLGITRGLDESVDLYFQDDRGVEQVIHIKLGSLDFKRKEARLLINAPKEVRILRSELPSK